MDATFARGKRRSVVMHTVAPESLASTPPSTADPPASKTSKTASKSSYNEVLERKSSLARNLSQPVIMGNLYGDQKSSRSKFPADGGGSRSFTGGESDEIIDMYIEDIMDRGNKEKKRTKEKNIRAEMGFFKLILHDFKVWHRRWKAKHQDIMFLKSYIKEVESNFGSGIGALFVFIRWVLLSNMALSVLWLGFLVLPTAVTFPYSNITQTFSIRNIFDAQGAVSESWLFYGVYPEVINQSYYLAVVYLFVIILTYFGSLFFILKSIGEGTQPAHSSSKTSRFKFSMILLTSWDHSITSHDASVNLSKGIASVLKDNLYEAKAKAVVTSRSSREKWKVIGLRCVAWLLTILLIGGGCTAIVYLVIYVNFSQTVPNEGTGQTASFFNVYGTTIIFSLINILVPMCISMLPKIEHYASGKLELNITLGRIFCLRMANLFALLASLYRNVSKLTEECTGTVIGQEFYKLVVMDTLVHACVQGGMTFGQYFWTKEKAEFKLSGAALVLIYRQGLVWVGTIACPVLPLIGVLSIAIFFFINYLIVTKTCKPPIKRWNQSRNTAFLMYFLLITISFIIVPVSVVIGSEHIINLGVAARGRESCGPFGDEQPTAVFTKFRLQQVDWLKSALTWIMSDTVLIAVFFILLALLYYQRVLLWGYKRYSLVLQSELAQERKDTQELHRKIQGYSA